MPTLYERSEAVHAVFPQGKLAITPTKPLATPDDLALAYSPGVAGPVLAIAENPEAAYRFTTKGNLVGVISNGSAILGLGNRGPLASKPVMEGKAVLFKQFGGVDAFDIELNAPTVDEMVQAIAAMAPTFGGINLEDIKAPECFEVEERLRSMLDIPVFHDDQHGTAVVACAGLLNALIIAGKDLSAVRIVVNGAGAAGIAIASKLLALGVPKEHLLLGDSKGIVGDHRTDLNRWKQRFAVTTLHRTLADAVRGADVFIGVSKAGLLTDDMLQSMANDPIVFALANPDPEIMPDRAKAIRSDVIIATGRSDFANQVNNLLCFPFLFRGALDARATKITPAMELAAIHALSSLTRTPVPSDVLQIYKLPSLIFGRDYILPKPFDPRLRDVVSSAVKMASLEE